ncbi:NAD(P)/FAD-dependent oxidoreductase [Crossiella cryophila]|uniref:2-polyprenyl-6-methoxyphenol hydroxylase-like FAD-dependent oxidoreductase n=1 Tax=Crossiella cryophila TaxID=43355 RepID=A0A7W7CKT8_9PSEU|nr:FAD-dependent oxidoreductase [Crossiella cryophila]MBB4681304.1 2-polyprenyl-6-methoxyphenol hydroxylase-like FAD-dependent oxidoreductase [Crossiella cryophila]
MAGSGRSTSTVDVAVVGGRVAGAALAARLARAGLRVAVYERAVELGPTLSTHIFHGTADLRAEGVYADLLAAGVPPLPEVRVRLDELRLVFRHPHDPGLCPPRELLDNLLLDRARAAGAQIHLGRPVVGLVHAAGRVAGVEVADQDGRVRPVRARLVVGADGRSSPVARWVRAAQYLTFRSGRGQVWRYYRGKRLPRALLWHRVGARLAHILPTGEQEYYLCAQPPVGDPVDFRRTGPDALLPWVAQVSPEIAELAHGGEPVGGLRRMSGYPCFFRQPYGPGWALAGDAGHAKDATIGHGITDALRNSAALADALLSTWDDQRGLPERLRHWAQQRDAAELANFWYSQELGDAAPVGPLRKAVFRGLGATGIRRLDEVMADKRAADTLLTVTRLARGALSQVLAGAAVPSVAREAGDLLRLSLLRRKAFRERAAAAPSLYPELAGALR